MITVDADLDVIPNKKRAISEVMTLRGANVNQEEFPILQNIKNF